MIIRMVTIAGSVALMATAVALRVPGTVQMAYVHSALAAVTAIALALLGVRATNRVIAGGGSRSAVGASKAQSMALVWGWGALSLAVTYGAGFASWKEWWHFLIPFAVCAALCGWFAAGLARDAAAGRDDETMLSISRYLAIGQLAGMIITMAGLVIDRKMTRFINPRPGWEDWPANTTFFFGALGLAILSAHALRAQSMHGADVAPRTKPG